MAVVWIPPVDFPQPAAVLANRPARSGNGKAGTATILDAPADDGALAAGRTEDPPRRGVHEHLLTASDDALFRRALTPQARQAGTSLGRETEHDGGRSDSSTGRGDFEKR